YFVLTPYQYGANNPIIYTDANGDSLIVGGKPEAINKFNNVVESGLGGSYSVSQDARGNTTLISTGKEGKMSDDQQAFYDVVQGVIGEEKDVKVGIVESSQGVYGGSYRTGQIDIDDIMKYDEGAPVVSGKGALAHELKEQQA